MKSKHYLHGGDLDAAAHLYNLNRDTIWDFSGNINPLGTSPKAKALMVSQIDKISTYPDRNYTSLRNTLGEYANIPSDFIMVGNGTSELISLIIHTLAPKKALTLAPTYSEYERELQMLGAKFTYYTLDAKEDFKLNLPHFLDQLAYDTDFLILCNPNNPTSTALTTNDLLEILTFCKQHEIFVLVDETYIEFCDSPDTLSAIPLTLDFPNLMVLRGISKFFSAPGLRFGYGICSDQKLLATLKSLQNPWSVNILATLGAQAMFEDAAYITDTHQLFVSERRRILERLSTFPGLKVFKPEANFVLLQFLDPSHTGSDFAKIMIKKNMLIRDASSFPSLDSSYFRFCFLTKQQNEKLLEELEHYLNH